MRFEDEAGPSNAPQNTTTSCTPGIDTINVTNTPNFKDDLFQRVPFQNLLSHHDGQPDVQKRQTEQNLELHQYGQQRQMQTNLLL